MSEKLTKEQIARLPFMDMSLDLEERVEDLLGRLTLEEKFRLCYGRKVFFAPPIKRLGVPTYKMCDGPHGLGATGTFFLKKSTYFPVAILRAATWNLEICEKFGVAAAKEFLDVNYHNMLGPGINIDRSPLCGRTFEYHTEDPYLNKSLVVPIVKGIQSQRIAACVKHYAVNDQELNRHTVDAVVSERALREIYLPAFEAAVREADVWTVMSCYNKVNGVYGSEHEDLLRKKLMNEWGFRGFVMSDWLATKRMTSAASALNAGLALEMPFAKVYKKAKMLAAFDAGEFSLETLDDAVRRMLRVRFITGNFDDPSTIPKGGRNTPEQREVARKMAEEGMVLLKNENDILPLDINKIKKIAVFGPNANKKHALGGGSSMCRAYYEITPLKGIKQKCKKKVEFVMEPSEAEVAIVVAGLNHKKGGDRENMDRTHIKLPSEQIELINNTAKVNPKTIVVLVSGSPLAMNDWIDNVPAILEAWYAGAEGGNVLADILFGDVNPSGKLPVTFPKKLEDSSAHMSERTYNPEVSYHDDNIFVGYRHFDKNNIEPLFPFGFGLSYTTFKYSNLKLSKTQVSGDEKLSVSVDITNTGKRAGAEIVQLYIQDVECSVERPPKELRGFKKVFLEPGKKATAKMEIDKSALSFWDEKSNGWKAEKGKFNILVGSSSKEILSQGEIEYL